MTCNDLNTIFWSSLTISNLLSVLYDWEELAWMHQDQNTCVQCTSIMDQNFINRKRMKLGAVLSYKSDMQIIICRYGFCLYCYLKIINHSRSVIRPHFNIFHCLLNSSLIDNYEINVNTSASTLHLLRHKMWTPGEPTLISAVILLMMSSL